MGKGRNCLRLSNACAFDLLQRTVKCSAKGSPIQSAMVSDLRFPRQQPMVHNGRGMVLVHQAQQIIVAHVVGAAAWTFVNAVLLRAWVTAGVDAFVGDLPRFATYWRSGSTISGLAKGFDFLVLTFPTLPIAVHVFAPWRVPRHSASSSPLAD